MPSERIRRGWHDASAMTRDYEWNNLPTASDQRKIRWVIASPSGFFNEVDAVIEDTLDNSIGEIGGWNGDLIVSDITPGMIQVLKDEIWQTDGLNEAITIVHYAVGRGWVCLQGWGRLKVSRPGDIAEAHAGTKSIANFRIGFDTAQGISGGEASSGGEFTSEFTSEFVHGGIPE